MGPLPSNPSSTELFRQPLIEMQKAVAHPTDCRLLEKSRQQLVKLAAEQRLSLRQNYNRQAPKLAALVVRYAHAKRFKRMNKALRPLNTRVARVHREVTR